MTYEEIEEIVWRVINEKYSYLYYQMYLVNNEDYESSWSDQEVIFDSLLEEVDISQYYLWV